MPFWRKEDRTIHFIEIPKTGTTSVGEILKANGWEIDKKSNDFLKQNHVGFDEHSHRKIYELIDMPCEFEFTTVRNPIDRFVSNVYFIISHWAQGIGNVPESFPSQEEVTSRSMIHFMHSVFTKLVNVDVHAEYNRYCPQHLFIRKKTKVFKLENETEALLNELKSRNIILDSQTMLHKNKSTLDTLKKASPDWEYAPQVSQYFCDFYKKDFEMFNYKMPEFKGKK